MAKEDFYNLLDKEINRIDSAGTTKRKEIVIEKFENGDGSPKAIIKGEKYLIFNSNDYLGLRFHPKIKSNEEKISKIYGAGPGAVRFISGTLLVHHELEIALARFHGREAAMIFSSAFAANNGVIHSLIQGQSKDSLVHNDVLVISDELNHRSIIDGIRLAGLPSEKKVVFKHLDLNNLKEILSANRGKFKRVLIITDGIFSMLGEYQNLKKIHNVVREFENYFQEGIITIVDDSHGVGAFGETGRGTEEFCQSSCDLIVATMGKSLGTDGGYVAGKKIIIDYLRESAAPYIYSNSISPGTAGAALASLQIVNSDEGVSIIKNLQKNISYFKEEIDKCGFKLAANSVHPIQPVLIGDPIKTKEIVKKLFEDKILVTAISYPIVPKGRDEIRVQLSALHMLKELKYFIERLAFHGKEQGF